MTAPAQSPTLLAPWRIGVDVGGTFTDMVLRDAAGAVRIFKSPSVPADPSEGVLGVLRLAAKQLDITLDSAAARLRAVRARLDGGDQHDPREEGCQGRPAERPRASEIPSRSAAAFARTSGTIARPFSQVLVPRYLRLPVRGRVAADGSELAPLKAEDVDAAAQVFAEEGVESVAVCLFNSFLDGAHERAVGGQLAKVWNGKWVSLSSEVMPTMGEYERGSTAVVNAYVAPKVTSYLHALDEQLRQFGLPRSLLLLQSNGGAVSVDQVAARPVMLVLSGLRSRRRRSQGLRGAGCRLPI